MGKNRVRFSTVEQIKNFVDIVYQYDMDMDLVHNRYTIDAKSIMGIFSLDLSNPLELVLHTSDNLLTEDLLQKLRKSGILYEE